MPRVKGGYVTRRRRKKVIKLAKGYYGSKHALYKTANEQIIQPTATTMVNAFPSPEQLSPTINATRPIKNIINGTDLKFIFICPP